MSISQGEFRLDLSSDSTFDANGGATSFVAPNSAREYWSIAFISVTSTSSVLVPKIEFYRGSVVPSNFVTGTLSGTLDVDSQPNIILRSGERLYGVWSGGDVGATGTYRVEGKRVVV